MGMNKFSRHSYPAHFIGREIILSGVMTVFYFGRLIALVNEAGEIVWRDHTFPKFLVEYLIEYPQPDPQWSRWN
jgi:hypothetical protein